jgi:transcriptional regulator with XRE-family HTH domain
MSDDIDLHLGKRMRRRRRLLGLTQQRLAEACGVRFQQIQKYECGANRISAARLWRVARALEVPVDYFFEGLGETNPKADASGETARVLRAPADARRPRLVSAPGVLARDTDAA